MKIKNESFNNKYEFVEKIGGGGMGEIFKYKNLRDNQIYAVKFIKKAKATKKNQEKFKKEILSLTQVLNEKLNKHFMQIIDYYFSDDLKCIIYEYIEGENLGVKISNRGFIPLNEAYGYMIQIVKAFIYMNEKGILHRDIKPQNIIVKSNGDVVICDFGLATSKKGLELIASKTIEGTIYFMSPEILSGIEHNEQSDIFSTGVLFFQMLFGHPPFFSNEKNDNAKNIEIRQKILNDPLPRMNKYDNKIPQAMQNVLIKATAKMPDERYLTFQEFFNDLESVLNNERKNESKLIVKPKFNIVLVDNLGNQENNFWKQRKNLPLNYWIAIGVFFIILIGAFLWLKG